MQSTCVYEEKKVSSEEGGKGRRRYLRQRVMESVVIFPYHTSEKPLSLALQGIMTDTVNCLPNNSFFFFLATRAPILGDKLWLV